MSEFTALPPSHDSLFKALTASPRLAAALLRAHLPADIVRLLADEPPQVLDGTFIAPTGRSTQGDRVIKAALKDGTRFYVLFEHKSGAEFRTPLQLAEYQIGIWKRHLQDGTGGSKTLPPVVLVVLYNGAAKWAVPPSLEAMVAGDDCLHGYASDSPYILRNLAEIEPERFSDDPIQRLGFVALHCGTGSLAREVKLELILRWWPEKVKKEDLDLEKLIKAYIVDRIEITPESLEKALQDYQEQRGGGIVATIRQICTEQGRQEGIKQGMMQGMAQGRASSLSRLVERRFGPLSAAVESRIAQASPDELDEWLDKVLDASSLEAMFGDTTRH